MTAITRADHAPLVPALRDPRDSDRAGVNFGAAMSHKDLMGEKFRVDPVALSDRKRAPESTRSRDPPPGEEGHARAEKHDANAESQRKRVDIKA
jgi:hypothetical protein